MSSPRYVPSSGPPPDPIGGLKDFQRVTVEHVFKRLYAPGASRRFLVADEVGLGKTLIARGVIAKAIEYLRPTVPRIDIVYICSNADIARQNIDRLRIDKQHVTVASRLTLLPKIAEELRKTKTGVNLVSFTPATSFDLRGGLGHVEERVLLYAMLREAWEFGSRVAPMNVFQGGASADRFRDRVREFDLAAIDPEGRSVRGFLDQINAHEADAKSRGVPGLREQMEVLSGAFASKNSQTQLSRERSRFVGELRELLAKSCIEALEPDLIILDEFQRFSHVLSGTDDESYLARELFNFKDVAVLLLSATPYKMFTKGDEAEGEDHYREFAQAIHFLERTEGDTSLDRTLRDYRKALLAASAGDDTLLDAARTALEDRLRRVMVRTERLASTPDRNGMLVERETTAPIVEDDVHAYLALQDVARHLEADDTVEYWKSAPFVLNFMNKDDYLLKREMERVIEEEPERRGAMAKVLANAPSAVLDWAKAERYEPLNFANARLRSLLADTVDKGAQRLLWVPPAMPYYQLGGPYSVPELRGFTKRLVFSSWRLVPRAIASCVSYEAERHMMARTGPGANTPEARKRRGRRLRFTVSDDRPTGMPILALMYPSVHLARSCDPVTLARRTGSGDHRQISLEFILHEAEAEIQHALDTRLGIAAREDGPEDERWYWAAPLLLDRRLEPEATQAWFDQPKLAHVWATGRDEFSDTDSEESDGWTAHVEQASEVARNGDPGLGKKPGDLARVLAKIALGAPGVTMLRSMLRVVGMQTSGLTTEIGVRVRNGAAQAAWSFRRLFDQPEVIALLEGEEPYWQRVLDYCVDGCLQAVLDEYAHVLRDHIGVSRESPGNKVHKIADEICSAMSLRTVNIGVTDLGVSASGRTLRPETRRMRCHFALRLGDEPTETGEPTRADAVRKAFNSPFWPFVLTTTAVGQEGLDFHPYCHVLVHWNLPTNPVDLEQREGRVHRYKGHAVRKNVAQTHGEAALERGDIDPWETMFEEARASRAPDASDIVPYWVYSAGDARIERHIASLPLSRELARKQELMRSLTIYRMAFGQPRQDDLIEYLRARCDEETLKRLLERARIDLTPDQRGVGGVADG